VYRYQAKAFTTSCLGRLHGRETRPHRLRLFADATLHAIDLSEQRFFRRYGYLFAHLRLTLRSTETIRILPTASIR
jgi:hypothetical protein